MFEALLAEVERVEVPTDPASLAALLSIADRLQARTHAGLARLTSDAVWEHDGSTSVTAWLRSGQRMTRVDAKRAVSVARLLASSPTLSSSWQDGRTSGGQVACVRANVGPATIGRWREQEATIVPVLEPLNLGQTVQVLQAWRARAEAELDLPDPDDVDGVLHHHQLPDGTWRTDATFAAEAGSIVAAALALATRRPDALGDAVQRTTGQRQAEGMATICKHFLDHSREAATGRARRTHIEVVLDPDGGATLDGVPVPGTTAARLACDAIVHRVVLQGRSEVLDYGQGTRTVPAHLFAALALRDGGCRHPGCDRPPRWTDAHHVVAVEEEGPTNMANLVLLCRRHHGRLHTPGWSATLDPDGTLHVTTPDGEVHTTSPPGPLGARAPRAPNRRAAA